MRWIGSVTRYICQCHWKIFSRAYYHGSSGEQSLPRGIQQDIRLINISIFSRYVLNIYSRTALYGVCLFCKWIIDFKMQMSQLYSYLFFYLQCPFRLMHNINIGIFKIPPIGTSYYLIIIEFHHNTYYFINYLSLFCTWQLYLLSVYPLYLRKSSNH